MKVPRFASPVRGSEPASFCSSRASRKLLRRLYSMLYRPVAPITFENNRNAPLYSSAANGTSPSTDTAMTARKMLAEVSSAGQKRSPTKKKV